MANHYEDVDVIISIGNGLFKYIFVSEIERDYVTVNEPNKIFGETEILNAFNITSNHNIQIQVSEFRSMEEAISYITDDKISINGVKNKDAKGALKHLMKSGEKCIVYSEFQF